MVSLILPRASEGYYCILYDFLIGPFDSMGKSDPDTIVSGSRINHFENPKWHIFGETNILHEQLKGVVHYLPAATDIHPAPTALAPERISWAVNPTSPSIVYVDRGLPRVGTVSFLQTDSQTIQRAITSVSPTSISFTEVVVSRTNGTTVGTVRDFDFTPKNLSSRYPSFGIVRTDYRQLWSYPLKGTTDFNEKQSFETIMSCRVGPGTVGYNSSTNGTRYQTITSANGSPSGIIAWIDSYVAWNMSPSKFPVDAMHNGDLAMEASKKVNANSVNMFAFLRDLKNPRAMIPKLKNLSQLKTHADNYLSVKYGILPTISDLQEIVGAMRRVKPYLDKNGYKTYNAEHRDSKTIGNETYELEQHIKLAIEDEDEAFQRLAGSLGNMGFDLTTENVWDLIPYSFVVDWFIGVGDFLERVDARQRLSRLNVKYSTWSKKTTIRSEISPDPFRPYYGTVERVRYTRWTSDQCPVPPLSLNTTFQDFNHWLESGALIVQRSKRK